MIHVLIYVHVELDFEHRGLFTGALTKSANNSKCLDIDARIDESENATKKSTEKIYLLMSFA